MLTTLKQLPSHEVAAILAGLTLSLLPQEESVESHTTDEQLRNKVLSEVYKKLHLDPSDKSESQRARLYTFLTKEMSRAALSNSNIEEIRKRVGERGELRPSLYKIHITDETRITAAERSISLGDIRTAVEDPDDVEHLLPERFGLHGEAVSLYSQKWETVKTHEISYILVLTRRKGYTQTVFDVIRIYDSDVDLSNAATPLDCLKAFVEQYGQIQQVGERAGKFFLYEAIPFSGNPTNFLQVPALPEGEVTKSKFFVKFSRDKVEIAIAYTILERNYLSDLKRHK